MSMFSEPPSPGDKLAYQLTEATLEGPLGGPSYNYHGAVIDCMKGGHVCRLLLPTHPLTGMSFGVVGTITPLVDLWLNEGRLPAYMRAVPPAGQQPSCAPVVLSLPHPLP